MDRLHHRRNSGLKPFKLRQEEASRIERVTWAVATPIVLCLCHKCWFYNFTTRQSLLPLTLVIFEWSLTSFFQSIAFFPGRLSTESKWISTVETLQRLNNNSRCVPSIYAHTPVRTCTAEIWKNDTLFIPWKSLFASFNRDDWYIFRSISVFFFIFYYSVILMASLAGFP